MQTTKNKPSQVCYGDLYVAKGKENTIKNCVYTGVNRSFENADASLSRQLIEAFRSISKLPVCSVKIGN